MAEVIVNEVNIQNIITTAGIACANILSNGQLKVLNTPVFYGWRDNGPTEAWESFNTSTYSTYIYNISSVNIGNCYNTSTGVFTCPSDGIYAVHLGALAGNSGAVELQVAVNGTFSTITPNTILFNSGGNSFWRYASQVIMTPSLRNDQITVQIRTPSGSPVYRREHSHLCIWRYS